MQQTFLRFITGLALFVLLLASACSGVSPAASGADATPTAIPTPLVASKPTYTVKRGDIVSSLEIQGRVIPVSEEQLFFRTDGRVRKVYVESGDTVTKGQVLADLLSLNNLEKSNKQEELNLRKAEINVEIAKIRQRMTATQTPLWADQYDEQMALQAYQVELAQIAFEEMQLQSSTVQTAIENSQIISPLDGKVLTIRLEEGAQVQAYAPVAVVGDDAQLELGAKLLSTEMENLSEGKECTAFYPSRKEDAFPCTIRQLPYPYGTATEKTSPTTGLPLMASAGDNTRIDLQLPGDVKLRLGEQLNVNVILEEKQGVLWLPPAAIRTFEGRNFVVVQTESTPRRVDIKTGLTNEDMIEVVDGLEEGQIVIAP